MRTGEEIERTSASARPWADLLDRHGAQWVASLGGERSVLWLDDYTGEESREGAVRDAVAEGRPVVVGRAARDYPAADAPGTHPFR